VNDALVESEGSHSALNGPVAINTYSNFTKLARVLGLDTKAKVKEWLSGPNFKPYRTTIYYLKMQLANARRALRVLCSKLSRLH
jgi:hypothetical protein